jgi:hypothetical protein
MSAISGSGLFSTFAQSTATNSQTFKTKTADYTNTNNSSDTTNSNVITANMTGEINTDTGFKSSVLSSLGIGGQLDVSV